MKKEMKIGYLGVGSWGFCLANLLASKGHEVICWSKQAALIEQLNRTRRHPSYPEHVIPNTLHFTTTLSEALENRDALVESVTSAGIRPVFAEIHSLKQLSCPIILTSKGIEQNSGLILPEVVGELLGEKRPHQVGLLSGPSFSHDVMQHLPTSVVASAFTPEIAHFVCQLFLTKSFRVYPTLDIHGVAYGGALKNVIAIACGIADGLGLGASARAALMTRGLHEMRKLGVACGCDPNTFNGLSGLGDLVLTCSSPLSRNFSFGCRLGQGESPQDAEKAINMAIEGKYTCESAYQLSEKHRVPMPITELVRGIIHGLITPIAAVEALMQRTIKEEHL